MTANAFHNISKIEDSLWEAADQLRANSKLAYADRHDNLEAVYKKLSERRDTADVSDLLKVLHRIVNEAVATHGLGGDQARGLTIDLSQINMDKLREEFAKKVRRKATLIEDIREVVERKLAQMLANNPQRMNYEKKYQEIISDYNQDKDRATVEDTFAKLIDLANSLDDEQRRAVEEGLDEDQSALFDLIQYHMVPFGVVQSSPVWCDTT